MSTAFNYDWKGSLGHHNETADFGSRAKCLAKWDKATQNCDTLENSLLRQNKLCSLVNKYSAHTYRIEMDL